jgi:phage/plasmid-associated DNA primase
MRRQHPAVRGLDAFRRKVSKHITGKGDQRTNIIDQGKRVTYFLPAPGVTDLFEHLEQVRLSGAETHFSERQGTDANPQSGIMLDYDIIVDRPDASLGKLELHRIACRVVKQLRDDLVFPTEATTKSGYETQLTVFSIVKEAPVRRPPAGEGDPPRFKYGFHLLIPGVRVARPYKKFLLRSLRDDSTICRVLSKMGAVGDVRDCLDTGSASVPVLFLGSCKRQGKPYKVGPILELTFEARTEGAPNAEPPSDFTPVVMFQDPEEMVTKGYNLVAEAALCFEARYDDRPPLVPAFDCRPRDAVALEVEDRTLRKAGVPEDELILAEHSLSLLALHDPEARHLHQILDLLSPAYYTQRNLWRNVVFALANTSDQYYPLAEWFSQKCPAKWTSGGRDALQALWADAVAHRGDVDNPLTKRSLYRWAQETNPARYREVSDQSYFAILADHVYKYGGVLGHYMVAQVLKAMLGNKFVVDVAPKSRGMGYVWFEFVVPGQPCRPGEVWKWRVEEEPDEIHKYISEHLVTVFDQVAEHIEERANEADTEDKKKYYTTLGARFLGSQRKIYDNGFKNGIVAQANYLFRRRGFYESLDREIHLLGVGNGVLRLGAQPELINYFHEYPIRRFTPVHYRPFNPGDPWTKLLLNSVADIFPEPDARDFILFHAAQCCRGGTKEGIILAIKGVGANGKTWFMRMVEKSLGGDYAKKLDIGLLTAPRGDPGKPNSAMMHLAGVRYGYFEETEQSEVINTSRLKEFANPGSISGRDLYEGQKNFEVEANLQAGQNFPFVIKTKDHGTWRRFRYYEAKARFRADPDPNNPLEHKDNPRLIQEYVNDPDCQAAFLSILVHYYGRLEREYGGQLKQVPCPTIDTETERFRNSQDTLNRFISQTIVLSPDSDTTYSLSTVSQYYQEWYNRNINQQRLIATDAIKDLENSALQKHIMLDPDTDTRVLTGCRVISGDETALREGETRMYKGSSTVQDKAAFFAMLRRPRGAWWDGPETRREPSKETKYSAPVFDEPEFLAKTVTEEHKVGGESAPFDLDVAIESAVRNAEKRHAHRLIIPEGFEELYDISSAFDDLGWDQTVPVRH